MSSVVVDWMRAEPRNISPGPSVTVDVDIAFASTFTEVMNLVHRRANPSRDKVVIQKQVLCSEKLANSARKFEDGKELNG